jgi:hypothetical protein
MISYRYRTPERSTLTLNDMQRQITALLHANGIEILSCSAPYELPSTSTRFPEHEGIAMQMDLQNGQTIIFREPGINLQNINWYYAGDIQITTVDGWLTDRVTTGAQLRHFLVKHLSLVPIASEAPQPIAEVHRQEELTFIQAQLQPMASAMARDAIERLAASVRRNPQHIGLVEEQELRHLCAQALAEQLQQVAQALAERLL